MIAYLCLFISGIWPVAAQRPVLRTYNQASGLPSDYVNHVFQDSRGLMWFSTDKGVCRYDGLNYKTWNTDTGLPDNMVYQVFEDWQGHIWLGTFAGLVGLSPAGEPVLTTVRKACTQIVQADKRKLLLNLNGEVVLFDTGSGNCTTLTHTNYQHSLLSIAGKSVLLPKTGTPQLLKITDNNNLQTESLGYMADGASARFYSDGTEWWVFDEEHGIIKTVDSGTANGEKITISNIRKAPAHISTLPGYVALGYYGEGIVLYGTAHQQIIELNTSKGLANPYVTSMLTDYEGSLWIATFGGGVQLLQGLHLRYYQQVDDNINSVNYHAPYYYLAGKRNAYCIADSGSFSILPDGLEEEVRAFWRAPDGQVFLGTFNYILGGMSEAQLNNRAWIARALSPQQKRSILPEGQNISPFVQKFSSGVSAFWADAQGTRWAGNYGYGIGLWQNEEFRMVGTAEGLSSGMIEGLFGEPLPVNGAFELWATTLSKGLNRISYKAHSDMDSLVANLTITSYGRAQGLASNSIYTVFRQNQHTVWVGMANGIACLSFDDTGKLSEVKNITRQEGWQGDRVLCIFGDKDNALYALSNRFLHLLSPDSAQAMGVGILPDKSFTINRAMFVPERQELCMATSKGLVSISLPDIYANTMAPRLALLSFEAGDSSYIQAASEGKVVLPWYRNSLQVHFAGLSYVDESLNELHYQLVNWDKTLRVSPAGREISYSNLPPGNYTLSVRLRKAGGIYSEAQHIQVIILSPFWQKWWFLTGMLLLFALFWWLALRQYYQRKLSRKLREISLQQKVQLERERISRDLHDHVGSHISYLINHLDWLMQTQPDDAGASLSELRGSATDLMSNLRETIWALNKERISNVELADRMKQYLRRQLSVKPTIGIQIEDQIQAEHQLQPGHTLNLFRIVQEAVHNIVKHSEASYVKLHLGSSSAKLIEISLHDNGIGFNPDSPHANTHYGLRNMQFRAGETGAECRIESSPGKGTHIYISLPMKKS